MDDKLRGALLRYRIAAWVVGIFLIVLIFVAVPLHIVGYPLLSSIVSPIHGFGYMVYLALGFDLARRVNWKLWPRTVLVLLAGTIPVMSFVAERWVRKTLAAELTEPQVTEPV
ncbi:MAG TPA: DUF3817 domain-containing protein [Stackebrandtia sp.]|uniref:DUF3817 domain-containing protein n=1 Tax=Stackebrandtia sp. TaxID=2023065 RepID=UPI002D50DD6C|nr:DUF3817 domain-containing protein [Stackebrandtia sp.]HZE41338.1 DUF3817 domain-containing protein [Stackebrandtia sp.]